MLKTQGLGFVQIGVGFGEGCAGGGTEGRGIDLGGNVGGTEKDPLPRSLPSPRLPPLPLLPTISLPSLRNRPPLIQLAGLGERCKLPQQGLGQSPSRNRMWCILALKSDNWWQQFLQFS